MRLWIGVDPGASGAIACLSNEGSVEFIKNDSTERDLAEWLLDWNCLEAFGVIERVGAFPGQGVSSTFKFGQSYGFLRGLLIACRIPFEEVSPVKWQTAMGCRSGGDKNVTKARAQQLFPGVKITHANADAILIAEYCRRTMSINAEVQQ